MKSGTNRLLVAQRIDGVGKVSDVLKSILLGYAAIVVLGSLFTYAKYNIFQSPGLSLEQLFDKLIIIFSVSGIIVIFLVIFSAGNVFQLLA